MCVHCGVWVPRVSRVESFKNFFGWLGSRTQLDLGSKTKKNKRLATKKLLDSIATMSHQQHAVPHNSSARKRLFDPLPNQDPNNNGSSENLIEELNKMHIKKFEEKYNFSTTTGPLPPNPTSGGYEWELVSGSDTSSRHDTAASPNGNS